MAIVGLVYLQLFDNALLELWSGSPFRCVAFDRWRRRERASTVRHFVSILLLSQVLPCSIPATTCVYGRYHTDPSGTYSQYEAKAIGAGSEGANTALQEHYNKVPTGCFCNCIRSIV